MPLTGATPTRHGLAATLAAACAAAVLAGCSDSADVDPSGQTAPASPPTVSASQVDPPSATRSKRPDTTFRVGERADVVYRASRTRTYRLRLAVVRVRKGSLHDLSDYVLHRRARSSSLYYVDVRASNRGRRNAGGTPLQLYGRNHDGLVLPPVRIRGPFPRCDTKRLPESFRTGDSSHACLVYLVPRHGRLSDVQVRYGKWNGPITWPVAGHVQRRHGGAAG